MPYPTVTTQAWSSVFVSILKGRADWKLDRIGPVPPVSSN